MKRHVLLICASGLLAMFILAACKRPSPEIHQLLIGEWVLQKQKVHMIGVDTMEADEWKLHLYFSKDSLLIKSIGYANYKVYSDGTIVFSDSGHTTGACNIIKLVKDTLILDYYMEKRGYDTLTRAKRYE